MSMRANHFYADHLVKLLLNGFTGVAFPDLGNGLGYDGQFLFSAAHKDGDGPTQTNVATAGIAAASYEAARVAMLSLQDEEAQPLEVRPAMLLVGPSKEREALEVVNAGLIDQGGASGVDNVFRGTAQVVVSQRLVGTYANYWFLADTSRPLKPLVWTDRAAPEFVAQNSVTDDSMFERDEARFKVQLRAGFGYGLWQFIYGSNGTT
jgi:phage major head subunit gpT-like protein